ncbi:unnamed protein product [Closterium sp. NIES-53]
MLALCREHRLEHRTKHIALRYFLARELQQRGQLRLAYVASEANTADIFTKALAPGDHQRFCTLLVCFGLLDWSCDLLFSPTLPMGPASRPVLPVRTAHRVPHLRPPSIPSTHAMALRPSSVPEVPDPASDRARAASPSVVGLLATAVTDPSFEFGTVSALVAELLDFAAACRLDYATALVVESMTASPPSVGGESSLGMDVLEDRQEDFECFAAATSRPPRSYAEAITGPSYSHWQAAMDAEMASWKSTGTYVKEVPPPGANIVDGMWILRVKWPPGYAPTFKARYVARALLSCRAACTRRSCCAAQPWLHWVDSCRTTLAALGFAPSTADLSLFLRTDTLLPLFYVLVYVDDLAFATADTEALALVKSELQKRHTCTDLGELRSYLGLQITRDRARHTITQTQSHMVHQVLQGFGFQFSLPQPTPLSTGHSLSAPPSDKSVEPSGQYPELVGFLMYLMTCTRPDLTYPLSLLARYVAPGRHRKVHWDAAKRVLRYRCSMSRMGLVLGGRGPVVLTSHADASWVDDSATERSSSCEAEIYVGAMAAQELCWLTYLLTDLGEQPCSLPILYQRGQLRLAYVATRANTSDIFTKALPPCDHQRCSTVLGLLALLFLTGLVTTWLVVVPKSLLVHSFSFVTSTAGGAGGVAGAAGAGGPGAAGAGGAGAADGMGTAPRQPFFYPQPQSSRLPPDSTRASTHVCACCVARLCPPAVQGTHGMPLRPSSVPQHVVLPEPPTSSLPHVPDPESRLDYVASLVTECESVCPPSVGGEPALSSDILEDKQFELECLAVALPRFASILLCPEGDPDALDIPTPCSYAKAIAGEYSSQWQTAMDTEMASWKSTGTYVDDVPPPRANIVDGMWIFRVKWPPGSLPAFKARYVARGFSQRHGVDFFQTFSPTPKMTTLRVLLYVAAQRDYELHSLEFSTAFLQGSLHEEIWLRCPPGFIGLFPAGTQWSLRRPVYGLRQAPASGTTYRGLHLRLLGLLLTLLTHRCFYAPTLPAAILRSRVLQRFGFQISLPHPTPLSTGHLLSAPPSDKSVEPSGPYLELVGCLMYLMTCTRPDLLARYVAPGRHRKVHRDAAKRVLRYLCSTSGMGLVLGGQSLVVLTGHSDASWADD